MTTTIANATHIKARKASPRGGRGGNDHHQCGAALSLARPLPGLARGRPFEERTRSPCPCRSAGDGVALPEASQLELQVLGATGDAATITMTHREMKLKSGLRHLKFLMQSAYGAVKRSRLGAAAPSSPTGCAPRETAAARPVTYTPPMMLQQRMPPLLSKGRHWLPDSAGQRDFSLPLPMAAI